MKSRLPIIIMALLAIALGYGYYKYHALDKAFASLSSDFEVSQKNLTAEKETKDYILQQLSLEQSRSGAFSEQIVDLLGTVGTLDKLANTDKELLQKYSKVYFLNEHYVPENLVDVPKEYINQSEKNIQVHEKVWPFLQKMLLAAKDAGTPLQVISGFRSFDEQNNLKASYKVTYGAGTANAFSADQGYSEHQLGTTLDFTTPALNTNFGAFESSPSYKWLKDNAYLYGFVLSYPKGNTYYVFEPWHWRFVGVKLATYLHNEGKNFYDLDQRTIDNYLINIFD